MADNFIGEIRAAGFNFAPQGWALCAGQILPISQNTALFSLLGTSYGGNGITNFALPDLRSRIAISSGQGPGLQSYELGEQGGVETVTLDASQVPVHTHGVHASSTPATSLSGAGMLPANTPRQVYGPSDGAVLAPESVDGGSVSSGPHANIQPSCCVNYIIALQGIFPSRG